MVRCRLLMCCGLQCMDLRWSTTQPRGAESDLQHPGAARVSRDLEPPWPLIMAQTMNKDTFYTFNTHRCPLPSCIPSTRFGTAGAPQPLRFVRRGVQWCENPKVVQFTRQPIASHDEPCSFHDAGGLWWSNSTCDACTRRYMWGVPL